MSQIIIGGRVDRTLDVKGYLIRRLQQEFDEAAGDVDVDGKTATGFPLVQVSSGYPTSDAELPAVAIVQDSQQSVGQSVGDVLGHEATVDEAGNEQFGEMLLGEVFTEQYTAHIFAQSSAARDLIYRFVRFAFRVIRRDLIGIDGIEECHISGGVDYQIMEEKGNVYYITSITLSLQQPHVDATYRADDQGATRVSRVVVDTEFVEP